MKLVNGKAVISVLPNKRRVVYQFTLDDVIWGWIPADCNRFYQELDDGKRVEIPQLPQVLAEHWLKAFAEQWDAAWLLVAQ